METGRERLNKVLRKQYREYRHRMEYIGRRLRWPSMMPKWMMRGRR